MHHIRKCSDDPYTSLHSKFITTHTRKLSCSVSSLLLSYPPIKITVTSSSAEQRQILQKCAISNNQVLWGGKKPHRIIWSTNPVSGIHQYASELYSKVWICHPSLSQRKEKENIRLGAEQRKSPEPKNMEGIGSPSYSQENHGKHRKLRILLTHL